MKKLLQIISIIILGSILINAQESTIAGELSFDIINNNGSLIEIEYELISPLCWDAPVHNITELFNGGSLSTVENDDILEFLACWETRPSEYYRTFGLGYYKFTAKVNGITKDYFYIDYRTSTLPENYNLQGNGDIRIDFNIVTGKLYYYDTPIEFPTFTTFWEEKLWVGASTSDLPNFWQNSLVAVPNASNHPRFVWGPYPTMGVTNYDLYRDMGSGFSLIATLSSDTYYYTDNTVQMSNNGQTIYYKIKPVIPGEMLLPYSNTVSITIYSFKRGEEDNSSALYTFSLDQNYPNPFNPTTTISFSVSENSFITLKVYDILGKEVSTIVNERLGAGVHQVEFDGSGLKSGIYFYEIRAGKFRDVKKLILLK